jgi:uncharacterized membrane protein
MKKDVSIYRHIAKTVSWRIVGTIDTMVLGFFITGDLTMAMTIGGLEIFTKMILYFLHERLWYKFNFGVKNPENK